MSEEIPKKRGKYTTKKSIKLDNLLDAAKEFNFVGKNSVPVNLKKDVAEVGFLTNGTCLFPNRYLDGDNSCVRCDIYENCACEKRNLGKKKK